MKSCKSFTSLFVLVCMLFAGLSAPAFAQDLLTPDEEAGLLQLREEEKLARDIYIKMYALYGKRIFSNIIESEQRHMDAVKGLLDRYNLDDPAAGNDVGVFTSQEIQRLFDDLLARGIVSLAEAMEVGVDIEKLDIADLEKALSETTRRDITRVYENLLAGSYNHLEAFEDQLD